MTDHLVPLALPLESATPRAVLLTHARERWHIYLLGTISLIVTDLADIAIPKCIQWIIDLFEEIPPPNVLRTSNPDHQFTLIFAFLVFVLVMQGFGRRGWRLTLGRETHKVSGSLKAAVFDRAKLLPFSRLSRDLSPGSIMSIATSDVSTARILFGWILISLADAVFLTIFTIASMFAIDASLTVYVLLSFLLMPFAVRLLMRREYERHHEAQHALSALNERCARAVASVRLQKLTRTGPLWTELLTKDAVRYRGHRLSVVHTSLSFILVTGIIPLFSYGVLFLLGIPKVIEGTLSLGGFIALQAYIFLLQHPVGEFGTLLADWQRAWGSLERVCMLLRADTYLRAEEPAPTECAPDTGNVYECRGLTFSYPGSESSALLPVTFSLPPGGRLGIDGPIGSGKSTLLNLLAGSDPPTGGTLLLYGRDIAAYPKRELTRRIALVPQRPFLFATTIRENITLDLTIDDDYLWHLLEITGLADEVLAFPHKLDTSLGEIGVNLSGGQRQRLTIARALARTPEILLLDDCLSAVDTVTEEHLLTALHEALRGMTVVWAAHRASTLRYCDARITLSREANR